MAKKRKAPQKACVGCGAMIHSRTMTCPKCEARQPEAKKKTTKSKSKPASSISKALDFLQASGLKPDKAKELLDIVADAGDISTLASGVDRWGELVKAMGSEAKAKKALELTQG